MRGQEWNLGGVDVCCMMIHYGGLDLDACSLILLVYVI